MDHLEIIHQQPPCFLERGWCIELPSVREFRATLCSIPDSSGSFHLPTQLPDEFDCFTDGAAKDPSIPITRLATWGWVLGDLSRRSFWPLADGGVPGLWQSVVRAEIFAVLSVTRFIARYPRRTRIWCDNQLVVDRLQQALDGQLVCNSTLHDHDLWSRVQFYLRKCVPFVSVHKVYSHQDLTDLTEAEAWIVEGNQAADNAANLACHALPPNVQTAWRCASSQSGRLHRAHLSLIQHMSRVAQLSIQFGKVRLVDAAPAPSSQPEPLAWTSILTEAAGKLTRSFEFVGNEQVFRWMKSLEQEGAALKQVCFPELLMAFQLATGQVGVENVYTTKHNHRQWQLRNGWSEYSFNEVSRSFSAFCCSVIKLVQPQWKIVQGRPSSFRFQYWTGILVLAIRPEVLLMVESWLHTHCGMMPFKKASDLSVLPVACGPPLT